MKTNPFIHPKAQTFLYLKLIKQAPVHRIQILPYDVQTL